MTYRRLPYRLSYAIFWLAILTLSFYSCKEESPAPIQNATPTRDDNMALGNPSGAEPSPFNPNNYLITLPTYSLCGCCKSLNSQSPDINLG